MAFFCSFGLYATILELVGLLIRIRVKKMTFEHVLSLSKLLQLDRLHSCLVHCEYHYFQIMEYLQDSKRRRKAIPGSEGYE